MTLYPNIHLNTREPTPTKIDEPPASLVDDASPAVFNVTAPPDVESAALPLPTLHRNIDIAMLATSTQSTAPPAETASGEGEDLVDLAVSEETERIIGGGRRCCHRRDEDQRRLS